MNNQYALLFVLTIFLFPYFLSAQDEDAALQAAEIQLTGAQAAKDRTALADAHLKLADLHHVKNHFPLSRDHYLQSLQNRDSIQDTDVWAAIHRKLGDAYTRVGSFEEALGALRIAADYYQSQHMLNKLGDTKRLIGAARIALGDLDEAEREFLECLELFAPENAVDTTTLADALLATGILYSKKADYPQALTYYHRAEDLYRAQNNRQRLMYVYNNISGTYLAEGNTPKTLDYLLQALSLSEEFDFKLGVLGGLSNIAMVYQIQKDYEQSLKYLERAERLNLEVGDSSQMARILSNKGVALQELNRTEEALDNHLKSLQLRTAIGDKTGMASSHLKLGTLYVKLGDLELANDHLNTALQLWKEAGDQKGIAKSYEELGDLALAQHQYQTALDWCQKGYAIAGPLKLAEELEGTCLCLTNAYEKTGDFRRALAFHQRYITVRDSTVNGERTRELTRMEMQYTFDAEKERITLEQQQKEALLHAQIQRQRLIRNGSIGGLAAGLLIIALLWRSYRQKQKSNRLLETQKNTIQQTLEERETLLKEIHHRVKNNLQVISSLLGLQALSIKDQQVLDAIEEGRNRVQAMALIHQNLYQEGNLVGVHLPEYIEKLTNHLVQSYRTNTQKIEVTQRVAPVSMDVDTLIPLGLILNELISNTLKYAFQDREAGNIHIEIDQQKEGLKVAVEDDGVGLPNDFQIEKSNSMGFKLIRSFVEKMSAQLKIRSQNGTLVEILVPQRPY